MFGRKNDSHGHTYLAGEEKGIDGGAAPDVISLAHSKGYDVAVILSIRTPDGEAPAPFSIIPVWLSLFSSGASMLVDTGRFAQASLQDSWATIVS